jgi:hypothetical protein
MCSGNTYSTCQKMFGNNLKWVRKNNWKVYFCTCKVAYCKMYTNYKRWLKDDKKSKISLRFFDKKSILFSLVLFEFELSQGTNKSLSLLDFDWYGLILYTTLLTLAGRRSLTRADKTDGPAGSGSKRQPTLGLDSGWRTPCRKCSRNTVQQRHNCRISVVKI